MIKLYVYIPSPPLSVHSVWLIERHGMLSCKSDRLAVNVEPGCFGINKQLGVNWVVRLMLIAAFVLSGGQY